MISNDDTYRNERNHTIDGIFYDEQLTHFPDGRIVTPRKIAAAKEAALSLFPPLAACAALADFGGRPADTAFFLDFFTGDLRGFLAAGLFDGLFGGRPGPRFLVGALGFAFALVSAGIGG